MDKEFTREELAGFDGRDGRPAYIARDGVVYDVSESNLWPNGEHMKRHRAGQDLSAIFAAAPHGPEVFERYPRVGILQAAAAEDGRLPAWLRTALARFPLLARHPHPMLVHFPIAFMITVPLFSLLALLTGNASFETTAFHCLGAGLIFTPLTITTGFFTWWLNYRAKLSRPITVKIIGSTLLILLMAILFAWRASTPAILFAAGGLKTLYLLLLLALLPVVSIVGWYGASLTFPTERK